MIDPAEPGQRAGSTVSINPSRPRYMPGAVVLLRPLPFQHGFGFSVVYLLFPKHPYGIAAVVPDHGGRVEPQCPALFLQAPADIDVVAGNAEPRIESTDRRKRRLAKCHVAARNVLGFDIGEQHMCRSTGRISNAFGDVSVARRGDVGTTHTGV